MNVFQQPLGAAAIVGGELDTDLSAPSVGETTLAEKHPSAAKSEIPKEGNDGVLRPEDPKNTLALESGVSTDESTPTDPKDREIVRLQRSLTEVKTASQATESQLRVAKQELLHARESLQGTFVEYTTLREELKTVKQTLGRDHQAVLYRKDIELFALRKANEQKEKYIRDQDAKHDEMHKQQNATIEVRNAQVRLLKDRLNLVDRQASPKFGYESQSDEDGDHALEVRLLHIRKGRNSLIPESEKDAIISKLQDDLAAAMKTTEAVVNQHAELQRAWETAKKVQLALREEKDQHSQTKEKLSEALVKFNEEEKKSRTSAKNRLPTIDENTHDAKELESMFDKVQSENLRLYAEVESLEKRLRDANSRMFIAEQNAAGLREELRLEREINTDMETARPSVVHQVHFQRMESQLNEAWEKIEKLKSTITEKDHHAKELQDEVDAAVTFHSQDQDEIERLKQANEELLATKQQLMLDHERLAVQRTRQRVVSLDRISARSSGTTLVQDLSPQALSPQTTRRSEDRTPRTEHFPPMPSVKEAQSMESIQTTPKRLLRPDNSPKTLNNIMAMINQDAPPAELRASAKGQRRMSASFKDFMKRVVKKNKEDAQNEPAIQEQSKEVQDRERPPRPTTSQPRAPLGARDVNSMLPRAAGAPPLPASKKIAMGDTFSRPMTAVPPHKGIRPPNQRRSSPRYYSTNKAEDLERPGTAKSGDAAKSSRRMSWGAANNKLKRRSIY